jgi:hypothetical protein
MQTNATTIDTQDERRWRAPGRIALLARCAATLSVALLLGASMVAQFARTAHAQDNRVRHPAPSARHRLKSRAPNAKR